MKKHWIWLLGIVGYSLALIAVTIIIVNARNTQPEQESVSTRDPYVLLGIFS